MAEIGELDRKEVEDSLNDDEREKRGALKLKIASFLKAEEMNWRLIQGEVD